MFVVFAMFGKFAKFEMFVKFAKLLIKLIEPIKLNQVFFCAAKLIQFYYIDKHTTRKSVVCLSGRCIYLQFVSKVFHFGRLDPVGLAYYHHLGLLVHASFSDECSHLFGCVRTIFLAFHADFDLVVGSE